METQICKVAYYQGDNERESVNVYTAIEFLSDFQKKS